MGARWKKWMKEHTWLPFSILLILVMWAGVFFYRENRKEIYPYLVLGDSIVGNIRDKTSVTAKMEAALGEKVYNGAFGGSSASLRNKADRGTDTSDCLSLVELTKAFCYQDYAVQNAGVRACAVMDYFPESVEGLNRLSEEQIQVLIIEHGVNDYLSGCPVDNKEDPYDAYTYGGALRTCLKLLQENYPKLRIVLVTPTYCWLLAEEKTCEQKDYGQGILEEYVNTELAIAEEFGVEVVDNYHDSGIGKNKTFEEWQEYTQDGIHLNEAGRALVAEKIVEAIKE